MAKLYPKAPKTELNYDEHIKPSLTPSKVITVIHAPITLFFAIDAQFNIYINGQITHWTDGWEWGDTSSRNLTVISRVNSDV